MSFYPSPSDRVSIIGALYDGRTIAAPFTVQRNSFGPGWEIMGTVYLASGAKPSATVRARAIMPIVQTHHSRNWNGLVAYGYRTRRDALEAAKIHLKTDANIR